MYAASASPRSPRIRWRIASTSSPNSSSCSGVRLGIFGSLAATVLRGLPLLVVRVLLMMVSLGWWSSELDGAVAYRRAHADADFFVRQGGLLAGQDVADGAVGLGLHAGEADAHPAAELRLEAQCLGLLEQRLAGVGRRLAGPG